MTLPQVSTSSPDLQMTGSAKPSDEPALSSSQTSQSSEETDGITPIPPYGWDDLQSRFTQAMEEKTAEEEAVRKEYESLMAVGVKDVTSFCIYLSG